ncbi:hypothetical protein O9G_000417 [Rozella allomycis CSF55]|uniref:Uncharacterized protein n=1 Tax=Rozella allomycis (strain CSF55) TaxID=988480 RepID=A0A075AY74_ROZAC|nr:hypothetical protein O9G_000417 [Rozella allomycis CSF55]|eukprot:EPZ33642.1 hypothetical protein O9G_000417 [Rozella allomycis CSF55]
MKHGTKMSFLAFLIVIFGCTSVTSIKHTCENSDSNCVKDQDIISITSSDHVSKNVLAQETALYENGDERVTQGSRSVDLSEPEGDKSDTARNILNEGSTTRDLDKSQAVKINQGDDAAFSFFEDQNDNSEYDEEELRQALGIQTTDLPDELPHEEFATRNFDEEIYERLRDLERREPVERCSGTAVFSDVECMKEFQRVPKRSIFDLLSETARSESVVEVYLHEIRKRSKFLDTKKKTSDEMVEMPTVSDQLEPPKPKNIVEELDTQKEEIIKSTLTALRDLVENSHERRFKYRRFVNLMNDIFELKCFSLLAIKNLEDFLNGRNGLHLLHPRRIMDYLDFLRDHEHWEFLKKRDKLANDFEFLLFELEGLGELQKKNIVIDLRDIIENGIKYSDPVSKSLHHIEEPLNLLKRKVMKASYAKQMMIVSDSKEIMKVAEYKTKNSSLVNKVNREAPKAKERIIYDDQWVDLFVQLEELKLYHKEIASTDIDFRKMTPDVKHFKKLKNKKYILEPTREILDNAKIIKKSKNAKKEKTGNDQEEILENAKIVKKSKNAKKEKTGNNQELKKEKKRGTKSKNKVVYDDAVNFLIEAGRTYNQALRRLDESLEESEIRMIELILREIAYEQNILKSKTRHETEIVYSDRLRFLYLLLDRTIGNPQSAYLMEETDILYKEITDDNVEEIWSTFMVSFDKWIMNMMHRSDSGITLFNYEEPNKEDRVDAKYVVEQISQLTAVHPTELSQQDVLLFKNLISNHETRHSILNSDELDQNAVMNICLHHINFDWCISTAIEEGNILEIAETSQDSDVFKYVDQYVHNNSDVFYKLIKTIIEKDLVNLYSYYKSKMPAHRYDYFVFIFIFDAVKIFQKEHYLGLDQDDQYIGIYDQKVLRYLSMAEYELYYHDYNMSIYEEWYSKSVEATGQYKLKDFLARFDCPKITRFYNEYRKSIPDIE